MDCPDLYDTALWKPRKVAALAAAATPWPILLTGPRGSGKSLLARFIHRHSPRAAGEFVEAPAPTLSEGLLQGELRGHVRGAFTDARVDHKGLLERANGGTLFFDEIEAASPALQALLVSLVEQPLVTRLGEERARRVNVRFIYASNANLPQLVAAGKLRADLLDRIRCHEIRLPAVREFGQVRLLIADRFLREALGTLGKAIEPQFSIDAMLHFLGYDWPGNLRELQSACRHIAACLEGPWVKLEHLPAFMLEAPPVDAERESNLALRAEVQRALAGTSGNQAAAARKLEMSQSRFKRLVQRVKRMTPGGGVLRGA